jgi:hypothetical protein
VQEAGLARKGVTAANVLSPARVRHHRIWVVISHDLRRDGDDESSERTQGWMYNVFSALYLAQPPHDAPPSIKCSLASMVVQVLQLLYLMLNVQNGVLAPDKSLWYVREA